MGHRRWTFFVLHSVDRASHLVPRRAACWEAYNCFHRRGGSLTQRSSGPGREDERTGFHDKQTHGIVSLASSCMCCCLSPLMLRYCLKRKRLRHRRRTGKETHSIDSLPSSHAMMLVTLGSLIVNKRSGGSACFKDRLQSLLWLS